MRCSEVGRISGLLCAVALMIAAPVTSAAPAVATTIDVGSSRARLLVTAQIEDYRSTTLDLLAKSAADAGLMARFLGTYYQVGKSGDLEKVATLFEPHMRAGINARYQSAEDLRSQFSSLRRVRLLGVLHWAEHQFAFVQHEIAAATGADSITWVHTARCVGGMCQLTDHQGTSQLGGLVLAAFVEKGATRVAPTESVTQLSILPPASDRAKAAAITTDPIVLQLPRASDSVTQAVSGLITSLTENLRAANPKQASFDNVAPLYSAGTPSAVEAFQRGNELADYSYSAYVFWFSNKAPWTIKAVYSLGQTRSVALLRSEKGGGTLHMILLQRAGANWTIDSDPSQDRVWPILSSVSTYQALRGR